MLTAAPEPGANPQSGLSTIRSGARNCVACLTRAAIVSAESIWPGVNADAAKADLEVLAQLLEHRHVAGAGRREFHRQMMHLQPVQLIDDRIVAALELRLAANARAGATARCTASCRTSLPVHDGIDHVHGEIGGGIGVWILPRARSDRRTGTDAGRRSG